MTRFLGSSLFAPVALTLAMAATHASTVLAQSPIQIRGQVENSQVASCYYCPPVTAWVLHGAETAIHSTSIDFSLLAGQNVVLTGAFGGTAALPVFEATAYQVVASQFTINGNSSIGNTVRFTAHADNGDLVANLIALNAGVLTLSPEATLLLNVAQAAVLDVGFVSAGQFRTDLAIPNVPSLVGVPFFGQALVLPASGAPIYTTEADRKRVQ